MVRVSDQPADAEHHYGHGKFESLSALGVTALLYLLAGGILVEAYGRLREGTPPPTISAIPFIVLVIDIAMNFWRARALHRAARATRSQALAADALHFASDVLGSFAVIAGLILAGLGFWWGDAAAAIAVAVMIGLLGLKMTRATVETLLDRAPEGIAEKAEAAIRAVPGVVDIERMRVRMVGPTYFIEAIAKVPRTYPIDRVEEIKRNAQAAVSEALGDADLTFTAVPVARDNESVRDRIMVIARNSGLAVHHVTVHDLGGKLIVSHRPRGRRRDGAGRRPRHRPRPRAQHPRGFRRGRRGRYPYRAAGAGTAARHRRAGRTGRGDQGGADRPCRQRRHP